MIHLQEQKKGKKDGGSSPFDPGGRSDNGEDDENSGWLKQVDEGGYKANRPTLFQLFQIKKLQSKQNRIRMILVVIVFDIFYYFSYQI